MALPKSHVEQVCKPGKDEETCKYLGIGRDGWICMKLLTDLKPTIDFRSASGQMIAQGDNCPGKQEN